MPMHITLDDEILLPDDAVTQTFAILAKRGSGKSYTASVMAEEMLKITSRLVPHQATFAHFTLSSNRLSWTLRFLQAM